MDHIIKRKLRWAVKRLDPANDDHWNEDGSPSAEAVHAVFGNYGTLEDAQAVIDAMSVTRTNPYSDLPPE